MATEAAIRDNYIGERKNQLRDGYGVYNYENKFFRYEGEWKGGKKHGHGKLIMADGSYYEGEFEEGEIEGSGFRYYATTQNQYSGQFHQGELHGQGVMKYSDGAIYEGQWNRNKKEGYGVFRQPDNSVYKGYLYNHKRHGEGTMIYSNGDRYDGDWVNDLRQGHGELRCRDGTIYSGQWRNDLYNGQGTIHHCSGMVYEGLWVNGRPAIMASRLIITNQPAIEIMQGQPFTVDVECQNEDGTVIEDFGRELAVTAGFRHIVPPLESSRKPKGKEALVSSSAALFDVIEDVEETPIITPFGYNIVSYPLTDEQQASELLQAVDTFDRSKTELSEAPIQEDEEGEPRRDDDAGEAAAQEETKEEEEPPSEEVDRSESPSVQDSNTVVDSTVDIPGASTAGDQPVAATTEESQLPPPVPSQRTDGGKTSFLNLLLPAAPPMYRPFILLEEEEKMASKRNRSRSISKRGEADQSPSTRAKSKASLSGDDKLSRPDFFHRQSIATHRMSIDMYKSFGLITREYVIMVSDVTEPPFIGARLEPGFIQVQVTAPKKIKKKGEKKEKGPRT